MIEKYVDSLEHLGCYHTGDTGRYMVSNTMDFVVTNARSMDLDFHDAYSLLRGLVAFIAPFGFTLNSATRRNFILEGDFGFKCVLIDIVLAVFHQLLPTAPMFLISSHWNDYKNGNSSFLSFALRSLAAVMVVWPMLIATFSLRLLSSVFINPITYHAGRTCITPFFSTQPEIVTTENFGNGKRP